jgi:hypothetical protein
MRETGYSQRQVSASNNYKSKDSTTESRLANRSFPTDGQLADKPLTWRRSSGSVQTMRNTSPI